MNTAAFRQERIWVTGPTARALLWLCRVEAAKAQQEPAADAADALAEKILSEWLSQQPQLSARQAAVRMAIIEAEKPFLTAALAKLSEANL